MSASSVIKLSYSCYKSVFEQIVSLNLQKIGKKIELKPILETICAHWPFERFNDIILFHMTPLEFTAAPIIRSALFIACAIYVPRHQLKLATNQSGLRKLTDETNRILIK